MKNVVFLFVLIGFISCQPEGRVFVEHNALSPNVEWLKDDVQSFEVPISDHNQHYDLSFAFRYANGYRFQVLRIKITEISPSGKEAMEEHEFKIRADDGSYIGEAGFDIWDSEHLIQANKKYEESGTYTYLVEHIMPNNPLNFAMEAGIILDKTK